MLLPNPGGIEREVPEGRARRTDDACLVNRQIGPGAHTEELQNIEHGFGTRLLVILPVERLFLHEAASPFEHRAHFALEA